MSPEPVKSLSSVNPDLNHSAPVLTFHDVAFRYGPEGIAEHGNPASGFAVRSINCTFGRGEVTALLGPNGSGKTTLMKLANRRITPERGSITIHGVDFRDCSRRDIGQRIGFVPQSERITFDYSVLDYVLMGRAPWLSPLAAPGEADEAIAVAAIERVGLLPYLHRSVLQLSGGQVQLVLLARVLTQQTDVLLLDEASSALDLANKRRFLTILRELASEGKTILLSTHEPEVAEAVADRMVLMKNGTLFAAGSVVEVFTSERLSDVYETPIRIVSVEGRSVVLWI